MLTPMRMGLVRLAIMDDPVMTITLAIEITDFFRLHNALLRPKKGLQSHSVSSMCVK